MTCMAEVITPELWEKIKNEIGGSFKLTIERRERPCGSDIIGTNRIIHVETGNYMCHSVPMALGQPGRWFFYVMKGRVICFSVESPSKTMLQFHPGNKPFAFDYDDFKNQITEIFGVAGFRLSMTEGWVFIPQFPLLKVRG